METISILGCGWLGFTLAKDFKKNYKVNVSIRTKEKEEIMINEGFTPYLLNEEFTKNLDLLLDTTYLFINFPPSKFKDYIGFLEKIYTNPKIKKAKKIIFISSTSIYPKGEGVFNENSKLYNSSSPLVYEAEKYIKDKTDVILRASGLMGYNRIAGKYFAGKQLDSEDLKVNYVHKDDVIEATKFVIKNNINGVFNLCSKEHPTRKEIYLHNALKYNFKEPIFKNKKVYKNRIIDGSLIENFGFRYKYPNPFYY